MASINKNEVKNKLNSNLEQRLLEFAQETLQTSGQNFDQLNNETKVQIINYTKLEAQKISQGIIDGIEDIITAINTNTNQLYDLKNKITKLQQT